VRGYKAQCELLFAQLKRLVERCEASCASLICEGVHLSISFVVKLMQVGGGGGGGGWGGDWGGGWGGGRGGGRAVGGLVQVGGWW
jgi:hypothetical protein